MSYSKFILLPRHRKFYKNKGKYPDNKLQYQHWNTPLFIFSISIDRFEKLNKRNKIKSVTGLCWDKCITNLLHNSQIKCDFRKFSWYDKFCFELGRWKNQCNMLKIVKTENLVKKSDGETLSELCQTSLD